MGNAWAKHKCGGAEPLREGGAGNGKETFEEQQGEDMS